jgi:hypothetical protein
VLANRRAEVELVTSNVATIAQDDQLDDEIIVKREIKRQDKRIRQTTLIKISINLGGNNKAVVMLHHFCDPAIVGFSPIMSRSAQRLMAALPQ